MYELYDFIKQMNSFDNLSSWKYFTYSIVFLSLCKISSIENFNQKMQYENLVSKMHTMYAFGYVCTMGTNNKENYQGKEGLRWLKFIFQRAACDGSPSNVIKILRTLLLLIRRLKHRLIFDIIFHRKSKRIEERKIFNETLIQRTNLTNRIADFVIELIRASLLCFKLLSW